MLKIISVLLQVPDLSLITYLLGARRSPKVDAEALLAPVEIYQALYGVVVVLDHHAIAHDEP